MVEQPKPSGYERYVVASMAMSCVADLLMKRWVEEHTESEMEELAGAIEMAIKNVTIEGLDYDQQEALTRRSVKYAGSFLDVFRRKFRDKS